MEIQNQYFRKMERRWSNFWTLSKEEMVSGSWVMQSAELRNVYFKMVGSREERT